MSTPGQQRLQPFAVPEAEGRPVPAGKSLFDQGIDLPSVRFGFKQCSLKGEDMALAASPVPLKNTGLDYHVFAVFDGHNGAKTAKFCKSFLLKELMARLPREAMPEEADLNAFDEYLESIRQALLDTFLALNRKSIESDCSSGCTASVMLVTGWLVTIANVGDSFIVGYTEEGSTILTADHRLNNNAMERARLESDGYKVARLAADLKGPAKDGEEGYGPLRAWPGALAMGRALGDGDAGLAVLPYPHISQIMVADKGTRFVLASDGLWDSKLSMEYITQKVMRKQLQKVPVSLMKNALKRTGLTDDTTILAVDVLPKRMADFTNELDPVTVKKATRSKSAVATLFPCMRPKLPDPVLELPSIRYYSQVNTNENVSPEELQTLQKATDFPEMARVFTISGLVKKYSSVSVDGDAPQLEKLPSIGGLSIMSSDPMMKPVNAGLEKSATPLKTIPHDVEVSGMSIT